MEEIQLRGLDDSGVKSCTKRYLDSDQGSKKSKKLQNKAAEHGISNLLKVPVLLLMFCVLFVEKETTLPSSKADIIQELINIYIKRAEERRERFKDKRQMLKKLGELSYNASQKKIKQMYIDKVCTLQYFCRQNVSLNCIFMDIFYRRNFQNIFLEWNWGAVEGHPQAGSPPWRHVSSESAHPRAETMVDVSEQNLPGLP